MANPLKKNNDEKADDFFYVMTRHENLYHKGFLQNSTILLGVSIFIGLSSL